MAISKGFFGFSYVFYDSIITSLPSFSASSCMKLFKNVCFNMSKIFNGVEFLVLWLHKCYGFCQNDE